MKKFLVAGIVSLLAASLCLLAGCGASEDSSSVAAEPVVIWDNPAGNSESIKADDMAIDYSLAYEDISSVFGETIAGDEYVDIETFIDTATYLIEIEPGHDQPTYTDLPTLTPFVSDESDVAVIVIPGGGYAFRSSDASPREGASVAEALQEAGFNAFVLSYRLNPYSYPTPLLDVQRAVRYLKVHAQEYGIDPDKIVLLGFSAGGFEAAGFANLVQGNDMMPQGYQPDEVDAADDSVAGLALVYPVVTFDHNVLMMFAFFDAAEVRDDARRTELLNLVDLPQHPLESGIPQFVTYSPDDTVVNADGPQRYIAAHDNVTELVVPGQDHGFSRDLYFDALVNWLNSTFN